MAIQWQYTNPHKTAASLGFKKPNYKTWTDAVQTNVMDLIGTASCHRLIIITLQITVRLEEGKYPVLALPVLVLPKQSGFVHQKLAQRMRS